MGNQFIILRMGHVYGNGKGISASFLPYKRSVPSWLKPTSKKNAQEIAHAVTEAIITMARKGKKPSEIGLVLRDSLGVPQAKTVSGSKILRIIKLAGMSPEKPEDLVSLENKKKSMREHLNKNHKDKDSKFHFKNLKSKIERLTRYYKRSHKLNDH